MGRIALTVFAALACWLPACGGGEQVTGPVADKVRELQAAFEDGRLEAVCAGMTKRAQLMIRFSGHNTRDTQCVRDVDRLRKGIRKASQETPGPEVVAIREVPGGAVATLESPGAGSVDVPLAKTRRGWKLEGVFGATASTFQRRNGLKRSVEAAAVLPSPVDSSVDDPAVAVWSGTREDDTPCPDVLVTGDDLTGGCQLRIGDGAFAIDVLGAFGAMPFAKCDGHLGLNVDGSGRAVVSNWFVSGLGGCGDIRMCGWNKGKPAAWPAQISRTDSGQDQLNVEACLDTCVGTYRGVWTVDLEQRAKGTWRLRAEDAVVGHSGIRFKGDLREESAFGVTSMTITDDNP